MSVTAAVAAVERLRPEQKRFLETERARLSMPAKRWVEELTQVVEVGRIAAPAAARCRVVEILGGLAALAGIWMAFHWLVPGLLLLGAAVIAAAWARWQRQRLGGAGSPLFLHGIEKFLVPCVRILGRDMAPTEPLRMEVDLRPGLGEASGPPRQLPGPYKSASVLKVLERFHPRALCAGQARLADGSRLSWRVADSVRTREVTKRGASGKIKNKTKFRRRRQIAVRLSLPAATYALRQTGEGGGVPPDPPHPGAGPGIAVKSGERRHVLKVRRVVEAGSGAVPVAAGGAKMAAGGGLLAAAGGRAWSAELDEVLATIGSLYAQSVRRRPARPAAGDAAAAAPATAANEGSRSQT
jgi:hypothetical protein